eukprot:gene7055-7617_t
MSKKKSSNAVQEKTWTPNVYNPLDELNYHGTDEDLRVSCRKLSKKDSITRQKALKEVLQHLQRNTDLLNDFIPFFSALFGIITLDPSHTCRDEFGNLLLFIVQHDKKSLRTVITDVIGAWWQLIHDPIKEVATKCSQALDVFIEGTSASKRFQNFTPKIILHFEQFFAIQSKEAFLKVLPFQDGWEENYIRIMTSNINALTDLINKVTSFDDNEGLSKNLEEFLQANLTEERITSFFVSPLTVTPKPPPAPTKAKKGPKPARDTSKQKNASNNKGGNNKGGHKSKRHDRGSKRKANAKKDAKAAKAALPVPVEIPPEVVESPFVISSVTSKQWKRCLLDCLLMIWQHFPLDKFNLLPESIPEDDEDDEEEEDDEILEISAFLNLVLEQFEMNDQVFNTLVMKTLFQFVRLYHDRFNEEDTLQVFLRLEKMAKTMVSLWLPIIASFPVELYSVYTEIQQLIEEVPAVESVQEEEREEKEAEQNLDDEERREEDANVVTTLAPPATPSSIVLEMIENTIEKNTIMEDLVSTLQIITFLLNKFPSNRDELDITATTSQTLLKAFVRIFNKIMDIKLLQPKNRSYSRFDQEREEGLIQDLVKCLRAMNKTTTDVFPTQWREFIWQPIRQHIETMLLSPSTKSPVRLELTKWISHVVNGVFEGISSIGSDEKTGIDCWYDPFINFTQQIYTSTSSSAFTSSSQFDDAYLPFQLLAELIKVQRWRQENLQFITEFLHTRYLPLIYAQQQTSYSHLANISVYLEALASSLSNNSEGTTTVASFYSSLFPYHVDVALKLKNLRVLNVLLKFYEDKMIPKIIINQQQLLIGLNSVQLKEIENLGSQIINFHLNSHQEEVENTSTLVDEVSYLIIILNLTSHHPKIIDKELLQKLFAAGTDGTSETGKVSDLFPRVFQLSLLATLKTVAPGTTNEEMTKITWKPLCVQLFFQTLAPSETASVSTAKQGVTVSQERDELRQIRKLLKIVLIHDWEAVRLSLFPLLTTSERQDCMKEINHIIHDEREFPLTATTSAKEHGRVLIAYLNSLHTIVDAARPRHNDCEPCALKIESSLLPKIFSTALWRDILTYLNTSSDIIRQQAKGLPATSSSSSTPRSPASRMSWPTVKFYWDVITQTILPIVLQEGSAVGRGRGGAGLHHHHHYPCKDFLQRLLFQSSSFLYFFLFIARMEETILPLPKVAYLSQRFFTAVVDFYQQSASSPFASNLLLSMTVEWLKEVDSLLNLQRSTKMTSDLLKVIERMVVAIDPSSANPLSMSSLALMNSDPQKGQDVWYLAKASDNAYSRNYNDEGETSSEEVLKLTWVRGKIMAIHNIEDPEDKFFVTVSYNDAAGSYREVQTHSIRLRVIDTAASTTSMNNEEESEEVYYTSYFDERKAMRPPDLPPPDAHPTLRLLASLLTEVLNLLSLGVDSADHVMLHLLQLRAHVIRWILQYYSSDIITSDPSSLFAKLCSLLIDISKKPTRSPLHASFLAALLPCFLNLTALHPVGIIITENLFFHPADVLSNTSLIQSEEGDEMKEDVLAADVFHNLYYQLVTSISWRYSAKLIKKIFALDNRFTLLMRGGDDVGSSAASAATKKQSSSVWALLERLSIHAEKAVGEEELAVADIRALSSSVLRLEELAVADIRALSSSVLRLVGAVWSSSVRNPLHPQQSPQIVDWEINLAQACIRSYYQSLARTNTATALEEEEKKQREENLIYIIHQFLNYNYDNSSTHINNSNRLALFEQEVVSEKMFYSNLLQRFPSYQQPANSLLQHSTHRFLAMKLFSCLDLSSSALITQPPMSGEEEEENISEKEGKGAKRRRAEEKFLSLLPEILREEMRYQFSMISSASSISSVIHSSSSATPSSPQSQQKEEMTVIGTIVEYEIKENFLFTWLMFLSYLDLIPSFLANDVKSSFSQFCDSATEGDDSSTSWFLILITTLLKWTSIDSITGTGGGGGGGGKVNNKALTRKDLFSIISLNFEELLGRSNGGGGLSPNSYVVLPPMNNNSSGDSSMNDDTVVSWFSRQRLEDMIRSSRLETISMDALVAHALYKTILTFPSMFRNYWTHYSPRAEKDLLLKFIHDHVRYAMISQEVQKIQDGGYGPVQAPETSKKEGENEANGEGEEEKIGGEVEGGERFEVIGNAAKGEITASIIHDESRIELVIDIPLEYPLKNVDITCKKLIGIAESKWLKWRLTMISLINSQDKSILEAILWWKSNLEKELDGLEPCIICYSVIHSKNSTLPSIACPTCKNKFHSSCLYTWFKTSGKNKCVLCQQPMMQ